MARDQSDALKIEEKLLTCSPFSPDPSLRNIVSGVVASEAVNVHEFESVGNEVIVNMVGQPIIGISFKRKYRSKTLADDSTIKVAQDRVIDPALIRDCSSFRTVETYHWKTLCAMNFVHSLLPYLKEKKS